MHWKNGVGVERKTPGSTHHHFHSSNAFANVDIGEAVAVPGLDEPMADRSAFSFRRALPALASSMSAPFCAVFTREMP
ncbi:MULTISPECIES: hypothetical protein [Burkholderia]|uniref:hypothetical protein n=1 Tax=Burkholderia TaxID=32008 RepID=UPI0012D9302D|nr:MULTISPECIES: hypothetical protein [Burkholderia]